jgi:hypothetical protein
MVAQAKRRNRLSAASVACLCSLAIATGSGCGDGSEAHKGNSSYAIDHGETVHDCLVYVGAAFAGSPDAVPFFWQAKRSGGVVRMGSAYDPRQGLKIKLLVPKEGGAKKWMLWYSQPPSASQSIRQIIENWARWYRFPPTNPEKNERLDKHLQRNYVIFRDEPTPAFRKEARRCVNFPLAAG